MQRLAKLFAVCALLIPTQAVADDDSTAWERKAKKCAAEMKTLQRQGIIVELKNQAHSVDVLAGRKMILATVPQKEKWLARIFECVDLVREADTDYLTVYDGRFRIELGQYQPDTGYLIP